MTATAHGDMSDPLDTGTWTWTNDEIAWLFSLPAVRGPSPSWTMSSHSRRIFRCLAGFAVPAAAEWTTASAGEDAVVHSRGALIDEALLEATFRDHPDVEALSLYLDLILTTPDGISEAVIHDGAQLVMDRDGKKLAVDLNLYVDIYAHRTWGRIGDNETLARLNAPRLATFLTRLQQTTNARLERLDTRGDLLYDDQFSRLGKRAPRSWRHPNK